ncbi:hypothetical protein DFH08DRAFT_945022 [Mycena albidolilacea]|uniref:Uncharacterized protein n=1 Tax=Mycena albidolilacea TaxID=1033008 RepID=A0AAD6Z435_9AGAR|nr:hypothetical protein DFH08DRAFT_945022 [Mycena albidolilacea]
MGITCNRIGENIAAKAKFRKFGKSTAYRVDQQPSDSQSALAVIVERNVGKIENARYALTGAYQAASVHQRLISLTDLTSLAEATRLTEADQDGAAEGQKIKTNVNDLLTLPPLHASLVVLGILKYCLHKKRMTKCDHPVLTRSKPLGFGVIYKRKCIGSSEGIDYTGVHVELERGDKVLLHEAGGAPLRGHKRAARLPVELDGVSGVCACIGYIFDTLLGCREDEERAGTGRRGRRRERYGDREIWEGGQSDRREWMGWERQGMEGVRNGLWGRGWGGEGGGRKAHQRDAAGGACETTLTRETGRWGERMKCEQLCMWREQCDDRRESPQVGNVSSWSPEASGIEASGCGERNILVDGRAPWQIWEYEYGAVEDGVKKMAGGHPGQRDTMRGKVHDERVEHTPLVLPASLVPQRCSHLRRASRDDGCGRATSSLEQITHGESTYTRSE